jgi:hypothetical protein
MKKELMIAIIEDIANDLQKNLNTSCKDWDEKESHAYIVGYLQSTVDSTISRLKLLTNKGQ